MLCCGERERKRWKLTQTECGKTNAPRVPIPVVNNSIHLASVSYHFTGLAVCFLAQNNRSTFLSNTKPILFRSISSIDCCPHYTALAGVLISKCEIVVGPKNQLHLGSGRLTEDCLGKEPLLHIPGPGSGGTTVNKRSAATSPLVFCIHSTAHSKPYHTLCPDLSPATPPP